MLNRGEKTKSNSLHHLSNWPIHLLFEQCEGSSYATYLSLLSIAHYLYMGMCVCLAGWLASWLDVRLTRLPSSIEMKSSKFIAIEIVHDTVIVWW